MPKKSESADEEEPKLENEGTNEEAHNVHISPTPADRKSPTGKTSKVDFYGSVSSCVSIDVKIEQIGITKVNLLNGNTAN